MAKKRSPGCNCCGVDCDIFDLNQADSGRDDMDAQVTWSGTGPFRGVLAPGEWVEIVNTVPSDDLTRVYMKYSTPYSIETVLEPEGYDNELPRTQNLGWSGVQASINVQNLPQLSGGDMYDIVHEFVFDGTPDGANPANLQTVSGEFSSMAGGTVTLQDFAPFTYSGSASVTRTRTETNTSLRQNPNGSWQYTLVNSNFLATQISWTSWKMTITAPNTPESGIRETYSEPMTFTLSARDTGGKGWTREVTFDKNYLEQCKTVPESLPSSPWYTGESYQDRYIVRDRATYNFSGTESENIDAFPSNYLVSTYVGDVNKDLWDFDGSAYVETNKIPWVEDPQEEGLWLSTDIGLDSIRLYGLDGPTDRYGGLDEDVGVHRWDRSTKYDLKVKLENTSSVASIDIIRLYGKRLRNIDNYDNCQLPYPPHNANTDCDPLGIPCPAEYTELGFFTAEPVNPVFDWIATSDIRPVADHWTGDMEVCSGSRYQHCDYFQYDPIGGDIDISSLDLTPPSPVITGPVLISDVPGQYTIEEWTYTWTVPPPINIIDMIQWEADEGSKVSGYWSWTLFSNGDGTHYLLGSAGPQIGDAYVQESGVPLQPCYDNSPFNPITGTRGRPYSYIDLDPATGPELFEYSNQCFPFSWNGEANLTGCNYYECRSADFNLCDIEDGSTIQMNATGVFQGGCTPHAVAKRVKGQLSWCTAGVSGTNVCGLSTVWCTVRKTTDFFDGVSWSFNGGNGVGVQLKLEDITVADEIDWNNVSFDVLFKDRPAP